MFFLHPLAQQTCIIYNSLCLLSSSKQTYNPHNTTYNLTHTHTSFMIFFRVIGLFGGRQYRSSPPELLIRRWISPLRAFSIIFGKSRMKSSAEWTQRVDANRLVISSSHRELAVMWIWWMCSRTGTTNQLYYIIFIYFIEISFVRGKRFTIKKNIYISLLNKHWENRCWIVFHIENVLIPNCHDKRISCCQPRHALGVWTNWIQLNSI